tara:strand:+ start:582 stop:752 length:171 start_codon:yes stop_codon:yes gene_type:complete
MKPYEELGAISKYLVDVFYGKIEWGAHVDRVEARRQTRQARVKGKTLEDDLEPLSK